MYQKLKNQFLEIMVPFLEEHEFFYDKKTSTTRIKYYTKHVEDGINQIQFDLRESVDLRFDVYAIIVNKEVNQIREKYKEGAELKLYYATVHASSGTLTPLNHPLYRRTPYCIADARSKTDAPSFSETITEVKYLFIEIIFPFFERYTAISGLDHWFNQPLLEDDYDFYRGRSTPVESLIVAKLVCNPHYERIYQLWLKNIHPDNKERIEQVKEWKIFLDELNV